MRRRTRKDDDAVRRKHYGGSRRETIQRLAPATNPPAIAGRLGIWKAVVHVAVEQFQPVPGKRQSDRVILLRLLGEIAITTTSRPSPSIHLCRTITRSQFLARDTRALLPRSAGCERRSRIMSATNFRKSRLAEPAPSSACHEMRPSASRLSFQLLSSRNSWPMNNAGIPGAASNRPVAVLLRLRAYQDVRSDESASMATRAASEWGAKVTS